MRKPRKDSIIFTAEELARDRALQQGGVSMSAIDRMFGRKEGATRHMLKRHFGPTFRRERRSLFGRGVEATSKYAVPERLFTERDVRYEAMDRRTIGQVLLGDPPPGFSALDRRAG